MNKLSKEKRNQLVMVVLVTIIGIAGLWFGLINFQQQSLQLLANDETAAQNTLATMDHSTPTAPRRPGRRSRYPTPRRRRK